MLYDLQSRRGQSHLSLQGPLHSFSPHGFLMRIICSFSDLKYARRPCPSRTLRTSVTAYACPFTSPHSSLASMSSIVVAWTPKVKFQLVCWTPDIIKSILKHNHHYPWLECKHNHCLWIIMGSYFMVQWNIVMLISRRQATPIYYTPMSRGLAVQMKLTIISV